VAGDPKKVKINSFIMYDGVPHRVLEREFTQKGLRPTSLTLILQRISSLKKFPQQFDTGTMLEEVPVTKREARFVMQDGDNSLFVPLDTAAEDDDSFDTGFLPENERKFLTVGMKVTLHCVDEGDQQQVVKVVLPPLVHYTVEVVESGRATIGQGATIRVPDYIKAGNTVAVSTVSGEFREKK